MLHARKILLVFIILGTLFTPILAENNQIEEIAYSMLHNVSASIECKSNVEGILHMPEESLAAPFVGIGEESGLLILKVSEDEDFESYAQLMALLGVETEAEEIPLYIYYHSTVFWDEASKEEYLSMIQESIEAKPDSGRLIMYLGDYYDRLEENKEESIRCYRSAYHLKPSDIEISFRYLIACTESDDTENASVAFLRIKERLQPIVHHSENNALLDKAASIYAGAISEMVTLSCRHNSFSSADRYIDELRSIPLTIFSRYANGFEALGDYLERSEQLNEPDCFIAVSYRVSPATMAKVDTNKDTVDYYVIPGYTFGNESYSMYYESDWSIVNKENGRLIISKKDGQTKTIYDHSVAYELYQRNRDTLKKNDLRKLYAGICICLVLFLSYVFIEILKHKKKLHKYINDLD